MDKKEYEEMLRKAFLSDMQKESNESNMDSESFEKLMDILKMGSLVTISKAANDELDRVLTNLISDLSSLNQSDRAAFRVTAVRKIEDAAAKLKILNVICSTGALMGASTLAGDEDAKDVLNMLLKINML